MCFFFFFKQKTAYEMRISDWSSDVCSSDLTKRIEIDPCRGRNRNAAEVASLRHKRIIRFKFRLEREIVRNGNRDFDVFYQYGGRSRTWRNSNRGGQPRYQCLNFHLLPPDEIGSAMGRQRVCQYV